MGIAEQRHPVGVQRQQQSAPIAKSSRLVWCGRAVKDIDVQAIDAAGAQPVDGGLGHLIALRAADGFLNLRVEILNSDRGAVHPRRRQRVQPRIVQFVRVDLDRELRICRQWRHIENRRGQIGDHRRAPAASACLRRSADARFSPPAAIRRAATPTRPSANPGRRRPGRRLPCLASGRRKTSINACKTVYGHRPRPSRLRESRRSRSGFAVARPPA